MRAVELKVVVHEAAEGGYWAEVPIVPGCATQGETLSEAFVSLAEAVDGRLSVDIAVLGPSQGGRGSA